MTIRISVNVTEAARMFKGWQKQVPYALSQALNGTVLAAQGQLRKELGKRFIIRSNWVSKGLQARFASKRDLTAVIGSKDPFMREQELGGDKTGQQHQGMAVPVGPGGNSPAFRGAGLRWKTLQSRWPSKLPQTFKIKTAEGQELVLQRTERYKSVSTGRGKKKGFSIVRNDRVRVIYTMQKKVKIKAKWGMRVRVALVVGDVLGKLFAAELASALSRAR